MTLLSRTKEVVKKRGINIETLAKKIGVSKSGIYQWDEHEPKPSTLDKAADALNVSVDYLLERTNDMSPIKDDEQDDIVLKAFDGKPIDDEDREKILEYARFVMSQKKGK